MNRLSLRERKVSSRQCYNLVEDDIEALLRFLELVCLMSKWPKKMWYHCWNEVIFIRQWKNDKERKWFLDLGLKGGNALLQSSIIHSATPIIRSSPWHEIILCCWLVGCDSYCYRCDGKGEFKEFTSYQHGIVSITWWNKTELRTHR